MRGRGVYHGFNQGGGGKNWCCGSFFRAYKPVPFSGIPPQSEEESQRPREQKLSVKKNWGEGTSDADWEG